MAKIEYITSSNYKEYGKRIIKDMIHLNSYYCLKTRPIIINFAIKHHDTIKHYRLILRHIQEEVNLKNLTDKFRGCLYETSVCKDDGVFNRKRRINHRVIKEYEMDVPMKWNQSMQDEKDILFKKHGTYCKRFTLAINVRTLKPYLMNYSVYDTLEFLPKREPIKTLRQTGRDNITFRTIGIEFPLYEI